jgi:hypothetical protein
MFAEPGFWLIITGAVLVAVGFIGLAFSRLRSEMPVHNGEPNGEESAPDPVELPNLLSPGPDK